MAHVEFLSGSAITENICAVLGPHEFKVLVRLSPGMKLEAVGKRVLEFPSIGAEQVILMATGEARGRNATAGNVLTKKFDPCAGSCRPLALVDYDDIYGRTDGIEKNKALVFQKPDKSTDIVRMHEANPRDFRVRTQRIVGDVSHEARPAALIAAGNRFPARNDRDRFYQNSHVQCSLETLIL